MVGGMTTPPTTSIAERYDAVIVGARAAGASTAMLLARRGLSVLAIDRGAYGSDTLSTHSLSRTGVLLLSQWGLLDRIRAAGTPVTRRVVFHYNDPISVDVTADGDVDGLYSPRRTVLDRILVDAAIEAGVDVAHRVSLDHVTNTNGRIDGVDIVVDGERRHVEASWVVGADGGRSRVAADVGAQTTREEGATATNIYAFWTGLPSDVIENFYDLQGRAVGIIPTNDGEANVWVAMRPEQYRTEARGDLVGAYHQEISSHPSLMRSLRGATCVGGHRGFPGMHGFLRQPFGPGWALVGDAGYFKDPLSAHGITDAFMSAEFLAEAIGNIVVNRGDERQALGRYARQRDELASMLMPPTTALARLDLTPNGAKLEFGRLLLSFRHEYELMAGRAAMSCAPC